MKIYIALFTTLIAAGHFTNVSAANAAAPADGASHPHLRALADAAVDFVCDSGCSSNYHCGRGEVCTVNVGRDCSGACVVACNYGSSFVVLLPSISYVRFEWARMPPWLFL